MPRKSRDFPDEYERELEKVELLSDADLEALLQGHSPPMAGTAGSERIEPGTRVTGTVVDLRGGEVLLELDTKTHGVIPEDEFEGELPAIGKRIQASVERHDEARELVVLGVRETRREVLFDELRPGMVLEGRAVEANKGGLVVAVKGIRAFLPLSQIDRSRVEDPTVFVGQTVRCEVTSIDRAGNDVVVSRRAVLEREAEEARGKALARLGEGETLKGRVVRVNEHGAFIDLGGVEGLLHASRSHQRRAEADAAGEEALSPGREVEVVVARIDRERGRVSLDFNRLAAKDWSRTIESYGVGDEATGWVSRISEEGAHISLDEGVEGVIPPSRLAALGERPSRGSILRVVITAIDRDRQRIELEPAGAGAKR